MHTESHTPPPPPPPHLLLHLRLGVEDHVGLLRHGPVDLGLLLTLRLEDLRALPPLGLGLQLHGGANTGGRGDIADLVAKGLQACGGGHVRPEWVNGT